MDVILNVEQSYEIQLEAESNLKCGACEFTCKRISDLHNHQQFHGSGGSYYFCHLSKTAYPRFELVTSESQTEAIDFALAKLLDSTQIEEGEILSSNGNNNVVDEVDETVENVLNKQRLTETGEFSVRSGISNKRKSVNGKKKQTWTKDKKKKSKKFKQKHQAKSASNIGLETSSDDSQMDDFEKRTKTQREQISEAENLCGTQNDALSRTDGSVSENYYDELNDVKTDLLPESSFSESIPSHVVNDHTYQHRNLPDNSYLKGVKFHACYYCEKVSYRTKLPLLQHFKEFHNNELPFKCDKCDKSLVSLFDAKKHLNTHMKDQFQCQVCDKTCSSELALTEHMTLHTGEKPFKCNLCSNTYRKKQSLDVHISSHSNDKSHTCEHCGKGFANRTQVLKHIRCCVKTVECNVCRNKFSDPCKLKIHMRRHTGERPYVCEVCGCAFGYLSGLRRHKKFIHSKQKDHKCSLCEMKFVTRESLIRHERVHTANKSHVCTVCGKSFRELHTLKVHTRIHTGESPYACDYCGQQFKYNVSRRKHQSRCPLTVTSMIGSAGHNNRPLIPTVMLVNKILK